jgi:DHA2 family multidrug resistance protein
MSRGETSRRWIVACTVLTGTIMAVLDSSIVNVALPSMRGTLGATVDEITWVVTGYLLSNVVIMPMIAFLSSRFGRKRFYIASVVLFTAASMLCGLARTLPLMVACRILQGIGGGTLITVSQAILRETFPVEEQGTAMGLYGLGVVIAPAVGPVLGGWITDNYSWPWIFYINLPVGILNLVLVSRFVHDPPYLRRTTGTVDWSGLALLTVGLGTLQVLLEEGNENQWFQSRYIQELGLVAGVGMFLFVWREVTTRHPAVDLRLLKNPAFASATALGGLLGMGLYGALFLLPLFLQQLLGYPAYDSGMAMVPRALAMAVVMPIAGRLYNRLGPRLLVGAGLAITALSFWQLGHLTSAVGFWDIFWPQAWQGVGFGLIFLALSTAALATVPRPEMTAASGLYNVTRQVFGSVGIAVSATMLTSLTSRYHDHLVGYVTAYDPATWRSLTALTAAMQRHGCDAFTAHQRALAMLDAIVHRQAAVLAYNHVFLLSTLVFVAGLPLALLLRQGGRPLPAGPAGE